MSIAKTLAAVKRTKQFKSLLDAGLQLVSTDRQLSNGTLAFTGKIRVGRRTIRPTYAVTINGAVISNEFVARRISADTTVTQYRQGLEAISQILSKRISA